MIAELRAVQAEADSRRHFTGEKDTIQLARDLVAGWTEPKPAQDPHVVVAKSASSLRAAAEADLFEVG